MEEPKKPIGEFVINNSKGTQTENGVYYHYSEVCRLLKDYEKQLIIDSVSNCSCEFSQSIETAKGIICYDCEKPK